MRRRGTGKEASTEVPVKAPGMREHDHIWENVDVTGKTSGQSTCHRAPSSGTKIPRSNPSRIMLSPMRTAQREAQGNAWAKHFPTGART